MPTKQVRQQVKVADIMTTDLVTCTADATVREAARKMRDRNVGDVLVVDSKGALDGILTDRDLVVRCLAEGKAADDTIDGAYTTDLTTLGPNDSASEADETMSKQALRRMPVVDRGKLVGILSLGDLAVRQDPKSALGEISAAPPNS